MWEKKMVFTKSGTLFTGRRKSAIAQVKIIAGAGDFYINGISASEYMQGNHISLGGMEAPCKAISLEKKYDIVVKVEGGGLVGQSQAIQLGVARALSTLETSYRTILKEKGFLRRDSRCKERRKYGLKKARKAPQFSKR
jgi:small subunit ribosomal protein S9